MRVRLTSTIVAVALAAASGGASIMPAAAACIVKSEQYAALKLKTKLAEVLKVLGCESRLEKGEQLAPDLKRDVYVWPGECGPLHLVRLTFFNGILYGTEEAKICLDVKTK